MKKILRGKKKFIFAAIALVLIVGILALDLGTRSVEVEAKQNIFQPMVDYSSGITVLEIVPDASMGEIGYFIPNTGAGAGTGNANQGYKRISDASLGTRYGEDTDDNSATHVNILVQMRKYGMIKYLGLDTVNTVGVSENPIYTPRWATFAYRTEQGGYIDLPSTSTDLVYGHYELDAAANSGYKLKAGYVLGDGLEQTGLRTEDGSAFLAKLDANYFYQQIQLAAGTSIVSENNIDMRPVASDETVYGYRRIESATGIPEAVEEVYDASGDLKFVYVVNQSDIYQGYSATQYKYLASREPDNGWFMNGNWFREYILGDASVNTNITYRIVPASSVMTADVNDADLVYISGTSAEYTAAGQDLSQDVVMALYNRTTQGYSATTSSGTTTTKYQAIMMDYLGFSGSATPTNNIDKLALLTWREDQTTIPCRHTDHFDEDTGEMQDVAGLDDAALFTELASGMYTGYNGNFAINNIYVYDHHWGDFQDSLLKDEQVDARDNFANGDLKSAYTAAAATQGFSSVLAYIKINNNNTQIGHVAEGVVTPALAVQYILSYRGEDLGAIKSQYSVLEIQPTKQFLYNENNESVAYGLSPQEIQNNRDEFISTFLGEEMTKGGRQEYVTFTSMTIDEFNTRQIDLLSTYDIIYIGDEWSKYYTHKEGSSYNIASGSIVSDAVIPCQYNDESMNGMIYYNLGDAETTGTNLRYSSRDLTKVKLEDLKNYLDKGSLIVVGKELMSSINGGNKVINPTAVTGVSTPVVDHGRVDTASNMYELLAYARGSVFDTTTSTYTNTVEGTGVDLKGNLVSEYDIATLPGGRMSITTYLGRSRLQLDFQKVPSAYSYSTDSNGAAANATYLEKESDGKYYLRYEFSITNTEVDAALGQTYNIHYYEDVNADGRFGETEEKTDISIKDLSNGENAYSTTTDGVTVYSLYAGVSYELVRQVPSDEGGIINWGIKVEKSTDTSVSALETGYTAIKPMNRKVINILQITDTDQSSLNLENVQSDSVFGTYLYAPVVMEQYDIQFRTITTDQFEKDFNAYLTSTSNNGFSTTDAYYLNYFSCFQRSEDFFPATITAEKEDPMRVDMIILGFGDTMEDFSASTASALKAYIDAGRPVLTSNSVVTELANTDLADVTGVDRYGYYSALYANLDKNVVHAKSEEGYGSYATRREIAGNAVGYVLNSERGTMSAVPQGLTNTIIRSRYREIAGTPTYFNSETVNSFIKGSQPKQEYMYVDKMNDGQITNFPYTIGDHVKICLSHAQDFQLDLDTDADNDLKSDAVAWFTLSATSSADASFATARATRGGGTGNVYVETPGDGINNYYIYNYGNVTYMGLGYYQNKVTAGEAQLFVNTLIAAYEAGLSKPIVNYYQTDDVNDGKLESIAVAYDGNITGSNEVDSSIIYSEATRQYLYKFVNPNTDSSVDLADATKAYFKITDSNFVRGEKVADVAFYLGVEGQKGDTITIKDGKTNRAYTIEEITLDDNSVVTVVRIPIDIYNSSFEQKLGTSSITTSNNNTNPQLEVGVMYGFYVPMAYLEDMGGAKIYIQANTGYTAINDVGDEIVRPLGTAYDMFTLIKQDLLKLD